MARKNRELLSLFGDIRGVTIYNTANGYKIRGKGGVDGRRIKKDPNYARTRENYSEFGRAARSGQLFRSAFRGYVSEIADNRLTARVQAAMLKAMREDDTHRRGERTMQDGSPELLEGLEFNVNNPFDQILRVPFTSSFDRMEGIMTVDIPVFSPRGEMVRPKDATHFRLFSVAAAIDFENQCIEVGHAKTPELPLNRKVDAPIQLTNKLDRAIPGHRFLVLGIEFLRMMNGESIHCGGGAAVISATSGKPLVAAPKVHASSRVDSSQRIRTPVKGFDIQ